MTESAPNAAEQVKATEQDGSRPKKSYVRAVIGVGACAVVVIGLVLAYVVANLTPAVHYPIRPAHFVRYLGIHEPDAPSSYAEIEQFAQLIGKEPNLVSYYSPWLQPFNLGFASSAAERGAVTLVQIDPVNIKLADIAAGRYDAYLRAYAGMVKSFGKQVILSFGHEMNGDWSSWGFQHTSPTVFVAAWRHIVDVFRVAGAKNITWMWTVNIVDNSQSTPIPNPSPWWPGRSYVNWVGIDGYFYQSSQSFAQVFGPTITDIRTLTADPILIAETGAEQSAGQAAIINGLFSGARAYGVLGFVYFDEDAQGRNWRIDNEGSFAALRRDAKAFMAPSTTTPVNASSAPVP